MKVAVISIRIFMAGREFNGIKYQEKNADVISKHHYK